MGSTRGTPYNLELWKRVRREILDRDGGLCQIRAEGCEGTATHVDHIVPWRAGGAWFDPSNLRAACGPCNSRRVIRKRKRVPSREW